MPDRAFEEEQLRLADAHIATAKRNISRQTASLSEARGLGGDVETASRLLQTMRDMLQAFEQHRALIVQALGPAPGEESSFAGAAPGEA